MTPRIFTEVQALYSNDMVNVFSGGLVYEFTQEPNNFGLVEILPNNDVRLRPDYHALKSQFLNLPEIDHTNLLQGMKQNVKDIRRKSKSSSHALPFCEENYENLDVSRGLPAPIADLFASLGIDYKRGAYTALEELDLVSGYKVFNSDGSAYLEKLKVELFEDTTSSWSSPSRIHRGFQNCTYYDLVSDSFDSDWAEDTTQKTGIQSLFLRIFQAFSEIKKVWG